MSGHIFVPGEPTNLDLHKEQARQGALLEGLRDDVHEIKNHLIGDDRNVGLIREVDRLKRHKALVSAIVWIIVTTLVGVGGTVLASTMLSAR